MSIHGAVVCHEPCPKCGSTDNVARYEDGYAKCFGMDCGYFEMNGEPKRMKEKQHHDLLDIRIEALPARGISEATCQKYRYGKAEWKGQPVQVAQYYAPDGTLVAQKLRTADKVFHILGDIKEAGLFGQTVWAGGGKRICITEGEIDCLSLSQAMGNSWPVVSVINGATSAKRGLQKHIEYLETFNEIVLCFDNDEAGRKAVEGCAELFSPGKLKIASLPLKDPNDMLKAGREKELVSAVMFNARPFRPDGVMSGKDTWEKIKGYKPHWDATYPWKCMTQKAHGMRRGELVVHTAGTGIGKSTVCREIAYHLGVESSQKVGIVALEESVGKVALHMTSLAANKPLHLIDEGITEEQKQKYWEASIGNGNFDLYDHWGSLESANLLSKIRHMIRCCECSWIILDHLSIVVSGMEGDDERKTIDRLMTSLRSLVEETKCGMHVVSHLSRRSDGKSHEEGGEVSLRDLRGSHAIVQLADMVWAYERDQQSKSKTNSLKARLLKNRYSGLTGVAGTLLYVPETGRIVEEDKLAPVFSDVKEKDF